ncbi:MAG: glycogen synthase GlgA [Nitrospirota bacterium]
MKSKLKVLMVSSEVVPFAKTGGLADVVGSLPLALSKLGCEMRIALPKYKVVTESGFNLLNIDKEVNFKVGDTMQKAKIFSTKIAGVVTVYFLDHNEYYDRDGLYGTTEEGDYKDNLNRFSFFARGILELLKKIDYKPQIIHCHDWQTGLIPVYLKTLYQNDPFFEGVKTLFTIHNLAYQGIFPEEEFNITGLDEEELFTPDKLEFWEKINLMKGALIYADILNTVSKGYAQEILTQEYGCGLEGVLKEKKDKLYGIINGIDYKEWDPTMDKEITMSYDINTIDRKLKNKKALQQENNLPVDENIPLLGMITRLADQKGLDILDEIIEELMDLDIQFVLLGTGEAKYHERMKQIKEKFPSKAAIHLSFDPKLAKKIYAGADMFLMPSKYEPCGLGQLISLRYGTVPIVRATGGLKDTITDFNPTKKIGNGFTFEEYSSQVLLSTIKRAMETFRKDKESWRRLVLNGMSADFSWEHSAKEYIDLYEKAMGGK